MCSPKEFIPLVHNTLSLMHTNKVTKPVSASAKEDFYMIRQSLDDVLKSPAPAEHSFVRQKGREATPWIVNRLLEEAS